jgi:hypothetical protein
MFTNCGMKPEVCSQKSTAEMSVARQPLVKTHCGNEYACINQCVSQRLTNVLWHQRITEESTVRLGVLYEVCIKLVQSLIQTARERVPEE